VNLKRLASVGWHQGEAISHRRFLAEASRFLVGNGICYRAATTGSSREKEKEL
jgi:hypothetical protein